MNRNRIAVLLVALLCVGALAVVASTVDVSRESEPGTGGGSGGSSGPSQAEETMTPLESQDDQIDIPPSVRLAALVLFVLSLVYVTYFVLRDLGIRKTSQLLVVGFVVMLIGGAILGVLIDLFVTEPDQEQMEQTPEVVSATENESGGEGEPARNPDQPDRQYDIPLVLLGVFGLVAVLLIGAISRFSGSEESMAVSESPADDTEASTESIQEVGQAAGRAADRLEDDGGDVENTVYRAWREMTDALAVDQPETTTPEEFADIAFDSGMDPDDVRELTWLFEEVRYGDEPVTEDREQRAQRALRRIEDTYTDE